MIDYLKDLESCASRQHEVKQDQIERLCQNRMKPLVTIDQDWLKAPFLADNKACATPASSQ